MLKLCEVHRQLGPRQCHQEHDEEQVSPAAAPRERPEDAHRDGERERRRYRRSSNPIGRQHQDAAREPERRQAASGTPVGVGSPRPVAHGGKRNPAITASVNPKSISCACQMGPAR